MRRTPRPVLRPVLGGLLGLLCGCGSEDSAHARWVNLAAGFRPSDPAALVEAWAGSGITVRSSAQEAGVWVDWTIAAEEWSPAGAGDLWSAPLPGRAGFQHHLGRRIALRLGDVELDEVTWQDLGSADLSKPGQFAFGPQLRVKLNVGERPRDGVFSVYLERGMPAGETWRAFFDGIVADGLTLWPGEQTRRTADVAPESVLSFTSVYRPLVGSSAEFRVSLNGELLYEFQAGSSERQEHRIDLPPAGLRGAELSFEVRGDPGVAALLVPTIGPRNVGDYGRRPWGQERPDLVLFLADTFRADNLAVYGGEADTTPELNRWSERCVRFLQARSPGLWTLPSHSSMFSGVFPPQHGAEEKERILSPDLSTLAEVLGGYGYRTAAITDSGFVSRYYAMDQGFGWFEERENARWDLKATLEEADRILERDDGRPLFLFVHTYRTHNPYRTGPEESHREWKEFMRRRRETRVQRNKDDPEFQPVLQSLARDFLGLYRKGASALDAQVAPWFEARAQEGLFDQGVLVFTSDHGEAFFEHGDRGHQGAPYDEKIRVPLLLFGGGLEPRDELRGASLIDVPRTLAQLAGVPAPEAWGGQSLLSPEDERRLYSFHLEDGQRHLAILDGERKVIARPLPGTLAAGEFDAAFEILADPGEQEPATPTDPWPAQLCRTVAPEVQVLLEPVVDPGSVELSDDLRRRLAEIGYGD